MIPAFLNGGGEMGELTRTKDWSKTALGVPNQWPQSLKTTLSIILNSKFPMFLFWGPDLICFYNDAYRPSLGNEGKHPAILGSKAEDYWKEIWHVIKPLIDKVLEGGEATWSEDQLIPIYRNGKMEDVYWTFSYSPVYDESTKPIGVFITCYETSEKVKTVKTLKESQKQCEEREQELRAMVETAPFPIGVYTGKEMHIKFANQFIIDIWGKGNDVIGKSYKKILPELDNQEIFKQLDSVYSTGVPYHAKNQKIEIVTDGKTKSFYFSYSFTPLTDAEGKIYGVMNTGADITEVNLAKLVIQKSEENLRNTILQAPVAMCIFKGENFIVDLANDRMFEFWGKSAKDVMHKPIFEGLPEAKDQGFEQILQGVYKTGKTFSADGVPVTLPRNGAIELVYVNFVYEPYREVDGTISGILALAIDVTAQLTASKMVEESEAKFKMLSENIPHMIWTSTPDGKKNFFNKYFLDYTGRSFEELKGDGWHKIIFPDDLERELAQWNHNIKTGKDFKIEKRMRHHNGTYRWYLSHGIAQKNAEGKITGWIGTNTEIEDQVKIIDALARGEEQFRTFANSIQNLAWIANSDGWIYWYNQQWYDYTGTTLEEMEGSGWQKVHHPDHVEKVIALTNELWKKDQAFELTFPLRRHDGEYRWFLTRVYPVKDANGNIERWIGTNTDITEQKIFTEELETQVKERTQELHIQNRTFELAESIAKFGSYTWDMTTGILAYSDNLFRLMDCEPQEFIPTFEIFLSFIHPDDLQEVISNGEETMQTGVLVETPYRIISKTGIIKYFRSSGRFSSEQRDNRLLIGTVQDISKDVAAAEELKEKNFALELANTELNSFSYIASHDLKEPLRKIQTFSKLIIETEKLSDKTQDYFNRIISAGTRMQNLIDSLLDFARANKSELSFEPCDLNLIVKESISELNINIVEKQAIITSEKLPTIMGVPLQLSQIFTNLISNSIKYSRPEIKPTIKITSSIIEGKKIQHPMANGQKKYYEIKLADNGIGFEKEYATKIFELFQRLHTKHEYSGTGIGLAIVKKIVTNHNGIISAGGKPNLGATFTMYFPIF